VLIDGQDGIIAGHGRVMAARALGLAEVPCIRLGHLTDAQKRAYVIADNKLALNAGWDDEMLLLEIGELQDDGFDVGLLGFEDAEIAELMGADVEPLDGMPGLPDGDREPFQQMTFTLHDEQVATVKEAMDAARTLGPFVDTGNENGNGNALARVCETFLTQNG
jgi:ParB-like chromosome segregation protein Spo0J